MSRAISWVMFVRIKVTTMATDLYGPITAGLPPGLTTSPMAAATRAASSVSCPSAQPCHSLKPQRLLPGSSRLCDSTGFTGEAVLFASLTRRRMLIPDFYHRVEVRSGAELWPARLQTETGGFAR